MTIPPSALNNRGVLYWIEGPACDMRSPLARCLAALRPTPRRGSALASKSHCCFRCLSHDARRVAHWQGVQLASVPAMVLVGAAHLTSSYANISPLKPLGFKGSSS